jgi:hypothetical protein
MQSIRVEFQIQTETMRGYDKNEVWLQGDEDTMTLWLYLWRID